ncbi:MAG: NAD-dependent epimerase/dehydratase family protein [Candidatus Micrarchaeota archaeon]
MEKILVTGAVGQIGSELVPELRRKYGSENVVAAGHKKPPSDEMKNSGPFEFIDVSKKEEIEKAVKEHGIDTIYHLAAILSAAGEKNPGLAYHINNSGLYNVLEIAKEKKLERIMVPSSIAVFGPETPKINTPNETVLKPSTMYGISKVHGELLGDYYFKKFGVDIRGVRYPGIISSKTLPGGGTTDYAVEIFYYAVQNRPYPCFLKKESALPMMYMPDALKALINLAEADASKLSRHCDYNLSAMSFSPEELALEIKKHIPNFEVSYKPDYRQSIADSWPKSIDDSIARADWGWKPSHDLKSMTADMIKELKNKGA